MGKENDEGKKINFNLGGKGKNKIKETKDEQKQQNEAEKFDLITIVESVEMEIPEKMPPFNQILYDFIPESVGKVTATKEDHVSKVGKSNQ